MHFLAKIGMPGAISTQTSTRKFSWIRDVKEYHEVLGRLPLSVRT